MYPQTHFLFPLFIGLLLQQFGILSIELALLAGLVGAFVDIDHYIEHIIYAKKNKFSLKATWNNSIKLHRFNQRSFIHHSFGAFIVSILLLLFAYFNWKLALAIAIGYYSHLFLDFPFFTINGKERVELSVFHFYIREPKTEVALGVVLFSCCFILFLLSL